MTTITSRKCPVCRRVLPEDGFALTTHASAINGRYRSCDTCRARQRKRDRGTEAYLLRNGVHTGYAPYAFRFEGVTTTRPDPCCPACSARDGE